MYIILNSTVIFPQAENKVGSIVVVFENIKDSKGQIIASLHNKNEEEDYPIKDYKKSFRWKKSKIDSNKVSITFEELPYEIYALSVFHDENSDDKLNTNILGIPTEGYGFSNNATGFLGPPSFKKAQIELKSDTLITSIKMNY